MKQILLLAALAIQTTLSAQCPTPACAPSSTFTVPLGNQNTYNNQSGSKCHTGTGTIGNMYNVNNADFVSYVGNITVNHPLNGIPFIYTGGVAIALNQVHMTGADTLIADCPTNIHTLISNNSNPNSRNVIALTPQGSIFVKGTQYYVGQTIQGQGNASNDVDVITCNPTPLGNKIIKFEHANGLISFESTESAKIEVKDTAEYKTYLHSMSKGTFRPTNGYWRMKVGEQYSSVIFVNNKREIIYRNGKKFNVLGQEITPSKGQLYFQNGAKYIQE